MEENKDTKICPFCGEEIKAIAKKCRHCKSWLPKEKAQHDVSPVEQVEQVEKAEDIEQVQEKEESHQINTEDASTSTVSNEDTEASISNASKTLLEKELSNSITLKVSPIKTLKVILIISIVFMAIFLLFISPIIKKNSSTYFDTSAYKDKYMFRATQVNPEAPTLKEILQINNAENVMKKELENSKNELKDEIFLAYLDILKSYIGSCDYSQIVDDSQKTSIIKNGLVYKYIFKGKKESISDVGEKYVFNIGYYQITKPMNNSLLLSYFGEGAYSLLINYEYLYKTYAKYLSNDYKTYAKIKAKELAAMDYQRMHSDGYLVVSESLLVDGILQREKYFSSSVGLLKDIVQEEIRDYTCNILWNKSTFDIQTGVMTNESKNAYEKMLNNADKSREEYKVINKAYHILKSNGFKFSNNFEKTCDRYSNKEYQDYNDY